MAVKLSARWVSTISNFDYTGNVQEYIAPDTGYYKLEVWGAQGGTSNIKTYSCPTIGGKGGYSTGIIYYQKNSKLYVYVGGTSDGVSTEAVTTGGWNGGGDSYSTTKDNGYSGKEYGVGGPGGGGTDISKNGLNEDNVWNTTNHLYSRIIVAGGGGGGNTYRCSQQNGNYGGGINGGNAGGDFDTGGFLATGGSQTSGGTGGRWASWWTVSGNGTFGKGGTGYSIADDTQGYWSRQGIMDISSYRTAAPGGGGGWYGGGAGSLNSGGGGSGYVYTSSTASSYPSGGLLNSNYYLSNAYTVDGGTTFKSPSGINETGHSGNGYARITYLGAST